jgi:hypothetical protein
MHKRFPVPLPRKAREAVCRDQLRVTDLRFCDDQMWLNLRLTRALIRPLRAQFDDQKQLIKDIAFSLNVGYRTVERWIKDFSEKRMGYNGPRKLDRGIS